MNARAPDAHLARIGEPMLRVEDQRFLTGQGRYVDDIELAGMVHGAVLLSPYAHARLVSIDTGQARTAPGVLAVLTGADQEAAGLGGMPPLFMPEDSGGAKGYRTYRPLLATDRVRCVGDRVAFVVAQTAAQARDALELIEVEYEELPSVTSLEDAVKEGAPQLWDGAPGNRCCVVTYGNEAQTEAAFAQAAHVTVLDIANNRLSANSIEPRGAIGSYDVSDGTYLLYTSSQNPHGARQMLAANVFHIAETALRGPALRALGGFNDPKTPIAVLGTYGKFDNEQKRDALNTLASRPEFARPLLSAVQSGGVARTDITADVLRQLRSLKDDGVKQLLTAVFGTFRESNADKKAEMDKYRRIYGAGGSQPGNASAGRAVYNRICAQCHTLFDSGGKVGPDITGANRTDLAYLLETIIDPNAVIPNEYRTSEIETKDGRSLTGVVKIMGDKSIMLQTANELVTIPRDEIESQRQTELSMMPEGLMASLTDQEVRDLLYYLSRTGQVPLPAGTAK